MTSAQRPSPLLHGVACCTDGPQPSSVGLVDCLPCELDYDPAAVQEPSICRVVALSECLPCRPGRQAAAGSAQQPGRRRETFLDRVRRVANQPALAGPPGPSLATVGETAIASAKPKAPTR